MNALIAYMVALLLCCPAVTQAQVLSRTEGAEIRQVLMSMFDKPGARLAVEPVVISGKHAIASWTQGNTGGRALLRRDDDRWHLVACGGDAVKETATLQQAGIPRTDAVRLVQQLNAAETKVSAERRRLFSLFGPVVGADAAHGAGSAH